MAGTDKEREILGLEREYWEAMIEVIPNRG